MRTIAVIGAGLMGQGIATELALAGYTVPLLDQTAERLVTAQAAIRANLALLGQLGRATEDGQTTALSRIEPTLELAVAVASADLVIEAVSEDLEIKRVLFQQLDRLAPPHAILASNTSSLLPSALAAATQRPDRVLVAHYFNPPYLVPLVELVRHPGTSDATVAALHTVLTALGKKPVIVPRELPGFLANRLQCALFREALALVEEGFATAEDIDAVVRYGFGRRLAAAGPLEIGDLAGWDVLTAIASYLYPDLAASTEPSPLLVERVQCGELGVKSGRGFYSWTPEQVLALRQRLGASLAAQLLHDETPHSLRPHL